MQETTGSFETFDVDVMLTGLTFMIQYAFKSSGPYRKGLLFASLLGVYYQLFRLFSILKSSVFSNVFLSVLSSSLSSFCKAIFWVPHNEQRTVSHASPISAHKGEEAILEALIALL